MPLTTHHIHNVLRAYSKQLGLKRYGPKSAAVKRGRRPDQVTISAQARRKTVIEKVTADVVHRILQNRSITETAADLLKAKKPLSPDTGRPRRQNSELVFKIINKNGGEVIRTLSVEASNFLQDGRRDINGNQSI